VKFELLNVARGPVVNEETAGTMASEVRRVVGADVGLALTGVAGPAEQDGRKVGTLCMAIAFPDGTVEASTVMLPGERKMMRELSVISSLNFLRHALLRRNA
jgi:nicotinamide-nucleotide amidase